MQAVQPCRLLSQGYNYEENPALDLYSIYQSRFATPCSSSLFDLYRRFSIFKHKQKKPIQFVWERYQNHKFNCVCVFLVS
jgi:hypothetical protein